MIILRIPGIRMMARRWLPTARGGGGLGAGVAGGLLLSLLSSTLLSLSLLLSTDRYYCSISYHWYHYFSSSFYCWPLNILSFYNFCEPGSLWLQGYPFRSCCFRLPQTWEWTGLRGHDMKYHGHDIAWHRMTSHDVVTPHDIAWHQLTYHHITWRHITSCHHTTSHNITQHDM